MGRIHHRTVISVGGFCKISGECYKRYAFTDTGEIQSGSLFYGRELTMIQQTSILGKTSVCATETGCAVKPDKNVGKEGGASMKEQTDRQQDEGRRGSTGCG